MAKPTRKTTRRWSTKARRCVARRRAKWRDSPDGRLTADGASKSAQIKRRLLWLVHEWQLPAHPPIGRSQSQELSDYIITHGISYDWLYLGDLKGLQRMMQWRRTGKPP